MMLAFAPFLLAAFAVPVIEGKSIRRRSVMDSHLLDFESTSNGSQRNLQKDSPTCRKVEATAAGSNTPLLSNSLPVQTYFVPLPEQSMFSYGFYQINPKKARPPIESFLSVSIAIDKTVIWYDHWEDGYDDDVTSAVGKTTEIWGDGNADNGCAPNVDPCTHSADRMFAGDVVVIQNSVPLPRQAHEIRYDGGDRLLASFPVAMTRGAYPAEPGSLMAGAVEVVDMDKWGYEYEAPVGIDVGRSFAAFQYSALFFMAGHDKTVVTLANGSKKELSMGEGAMVFVNQGHQIKSNKPIQVDLITGDVWSYYEMRWYSLLPIEDFSTSYVSPVGDTFGKTKVLLYNPNHSTINVTVNYLEYSKEGVKAKHYVKIIAPKQYQLTAVIPTYSGASLDGSDTFLALSLTDTEDTVASGQGTGSQWYDWGFPVVPRDKLTSQVLIGWGYGCTDKKCYGQKDRSVVWVAPSGDADVYVDLSNSGKPNGMVPLKALQSVRVTDPFDDDMSGALIYAVEPGSGPTGPGVDLAAAWGQDPSVSYQYQGLSMDLGTTVLPFTTINVAKLVDKSFVSPGEEMKYTIRVSNVGQRQVDAYQLKVQDVLDDDVVYLEGSMSYVVGDLGCGIDDDAEGTPFALDDDGYTIPVDISRRGGVVDIIFKVLVSMNVAKDRVINTGRVIDQRGEVLQFSTSSVVSMEARIALSNKVYFGHDGGAKCGKSEARDFQEGHYGDELTYCFEVTNVGTTSLASIVVNDDELSFTQTHEKSIEAGDSITMIFETTLEESLANTATVRANPVFGDGTDIESLEDVEASDPSEVEQLNFSPAIGLENSVKRDEGSDCSSSVEHISDIVGTAVEYCFTVTNIGNTGLSSIVLENESLSYRIDLKSSLSPGEKTTLVVPSSITSDMVNNAVVVATPVLASGVVIPTGTVSTEDTSQVSLLTFDPAIKIENTVYLSHDSGAKCGSAHAVNYVSGVFDAEVTYCLRVTNTGDTHLTAIAVNDAELSYKDASIGELAPGYSAMLVLPLKVSGSLKNVATVTANPITSDGRDIPNLADVTDSDTSEVAQMHRDANVLIENTVYVGDDNGLSCGKNTASESVEAFKHEVVTFCFTVKNDGDTSLETTISNPTLQYTKAIGIVPPGVSKTIFYVSEVLGTRSNTASVLGTPVLASGTTIPGHSAVTDDDVSSVTELAYKPSVSIENTVYLAKTGPSSCQESSDSVSSTFGQPITYCWNVTNSGNTALTSVRLENAELGFQSPGSDDVILPGQSSLVTFSSSITDDLINRCTVLATPVKNDGSELALGDVTHTDTSSVERVPLNPMISIRNQVYIGDDDGAGCSSSGESVTGIFFTDVVYCFNVTNIGDTHLDNMVVWDDDLDFSKQMDQQLAPGDSVTISLPGKIHNNLVNKASVTGRPILENGKEILGLAAVEDSDTSSVTKLTYSASISVTNKAVLGSDESKCKGVEPTDYVQAKFGKFVTYCFVVKNTGEQSHLGTITLANKQLTFFETLDGTIAPGESRVAALVTTMNGNITNTVIATGSPVLEDGTPITDLDEVTSSDDSVVGLIPHSPSVGIKTKVYSGNDDDGSRCGTAREQIEGPYGTPITYCLHVVNNGDVALSNVNVTMGETGFANIVAYLAPGDSKTLHVTGTISTNPTPTASVTADPVLDDGSEMPFLNSVSDSDAVEVEVVALEPGIVAKNTVFLVSDDSVSCGEESKQKSTAGFTLSDIVYCFAIQNSGDTHLSNVVLTNEALSFHDNTTIASLEPGETKYITVSDKISGNLTNSIVVTATPVTVSGETISGVGDVTHSDDSNVSEVYYSPSVSIDNLVYQGLGAGEACNSTNARNLVVGQAGVNVTYCFIVTNTGNSYLDSLVIENSALSYSIQSPGVLAPGDTRTLSVASTISGDLVNTAVVKGIATAPDGTEVPDQDKVTSSDSSSVEQVVLLPGVKLVNKVALGHEDGVCKTDAAVETVEGSFGTPVSFCFTIVNTGDTYLDEIVLDSSKLGFTKDEITVLALGEETLVVVKSTIQADNVIDAKATAYPAPVDGSIAFDYGAVSSSDDSSVEMTPLSSSIRVENTVYVGTDGGKSCLGHVDAEFDPQETAKGRFGSPCFYCLNVTNVGETYLSNIQIVDEELAFTNSTRDALAPGESLVYLVLREIRADQKNTAVVVANPSLPDGRDIPASENVTSSDSSEVYVSEHSPSIKIQNKVYLGDNDGQSCGTEVAVEFVESYHLASVTYCFEVSNDGDSYLDDVHVSDPSLKFEDDSIGRLAPGESVMLAVAGSISSPLQNVAIVSANPILKNGTDIPNIDDVSHSDSSSVDELAYEASILIENTVYEGDDIGQSCASQGKNEISGNKGASVVYCFKVTNTGETYLANPTIQNEQLGLEDGSIHILAPKQSELVVFTSTISESLVNHAVVTAQPALENGQAIADSGAVSNKDDSTVLMTSLVDGSVKQGDKMDFTPAVGASQCLEDNYREAGRVDPLICASNEVFLDSVFNEVPKTCAHGESITVTIDASIRMANDPRFDLGWYVAIDGGDALEGSCLINGFKRGNTYQVKEGGDLIGEVVWDGDEGDGDECGDVLTSGGTITTPFVVEATLPCMDSNDDGSLDFSVCFTWRGGDDGNSCTLAKNIPSEGSGGCYCARYDVANIQVKREFDDAGDAVACT